MSGLTPSPGAPRYDLERRIATGGMGEVWLATDSVLGREVAVKILKHEYADDPGLRARFETEARHAAALDHPNVASVFDFGELPPDDGSGTPRPFLVMELVPGEPLSTLLRGGEPMPASTAADLVAQAADAVAAAHALDIIHRDIKPANLLVTPDGIVKITDFGIARAVDAAAVTATGQIVGTPQYLSPEQVEGRPATKASDIYALGVVLYEALSGGRPFEGDSPISTALKHLREEAPPLPEDVPPHLRDIVARALAKDPSQRFASAGDLAAALRGRTVDAPAAAPVAAGLVAGAGAAGAAAAVAASEDVQDQDGTRVMTMPPAPSTSHRRRRLPGWLPWAAAAVAVLLAVVALAAVAGRNQGNASAVSTPGVGPTTSGSPSASPSPKDRRIEVRSADYIGLKRDEATKQLEHKGLNVDDTTVTNPGGYEQDTVADLSPTGLLAPGTTVTLQVWGPAPKPGKPKNDHEHGPKHGEKKGKNG